MMLMWVVIPMIEDGTGGGYDECAANTKIDINHNLLRVEHIIKYIKIYIYIHMCCALTRHKSDLPTFTLMYFKEKDATILSESWNRTQ